MPEPKLSRRAFSRAALFAAGVLCLNSRPSTHAQADTENGAEIYARLCASCHGPEGAGLVGPNLTDAEIVHGSSLEEIRRVIADGVEGKAMPPWKSVLSEQEIASAAAFVKSMMGKNLVGPNQRDTSTVTPFPQGTLDRPLLIRTFMPTLELPDAVFDHHGDGEPTPRYSPPTATVDPERIDPTIPGVPGAIAVNFGERLSYCFDSTECRLLYTWDGGFLDMTDYWGAGEGGGRKSFGYLADVIGEVRHRAPAAPLFEGTPTFRGYRKVDSVPEFEYTIGDLEVSLRIEPGDRKGVAVCHYRTNASKRLRLPLPADDSVTVSSSTGKIANAVLTLSAKQARDFTLTLSPKADRP